MDKESRITGQFKSSNSKSEANDSNPNSDEELEEGGEESKHDSDENMNSYSGMIKNDISNEILTKDGNKHKMTKFITTIILASLGDDRHIDKLHLKLMDHYSK